MIEELENRLRDEFERSTRSMPENPDPYGSVRDALPVRRGRRGKGRKGTAGMVLAAAAVLVSAAIVVPQLIDRPAITKQDNEVTTPDPPMREAWPVRGSLADDPAYLEKAESWIGDSHGGKKVRILYAGDVGRDRVVVAVAGDRTPMLTSVVGPRGSDERLNGWAGDSLAAPRGVAAVRLRDDRVLTLAAPSVERIEFSTGPRIHSDGTITRKWDRLQGERLERGVVVTAQPIGATKPSFRAFAAGRIVDEARIESIDLGGGGIDPGVKKLVERTPGASAVRGLASALSGLQRSVLGPDRITGLAVPRRITGDKLGIWTRVEVRTGGGGAIDLLLWQQDKESTDIYLARAVPADRLGGTPMTWTEGCRTYGLIPASMSTAARVEFTVDGRSVDSVPVKGGTFTKVFCGSQDPPASWDKAKISAELVTADGERLWKGTPTKFSEGHHSSLDTPLRRR